MEKVVFLDRIRLILIIWSGILLLSSHAWAQRTPPTYRTVELQPDRSVIFKLKAPQATQVLVNGTWPAQYQRSVVMERKDSLFEAKVGPLPADAYEYEFIVDGIPTLDPHSSLVTRDGPWIQNFLLVPGPESLAYEAQDVPHGTVSAIWYPATTLNMTRRLHVYFPPGYFESKRKYPVMYLLHGGGGDEEGWLDRGRAHHILDNLISNGQCEPMVVVITNGNPQYPAAPLSRSLSRPIVVQAGIASMASRKFETSLVQDVIPFIEQNFRVHTDATHRAITGFSMGGYQTQNITNANPEMFKYIGVMSMGLFSSALRGASDYVKEDHVRQLKALQAAGPIVYWIGMGKDDFLFQSGVKLRELYDEVGFKYTYRENDGSHDWTSWRLYLKEFAALCFK